MSATPTRAVLSVITGLLLGTGTALAGAPSAPAAARNGDRCAVCGMLVSAYPAWSAQIAFADGSRAYFDGAKDLFNYLHARDRFLPDKRDVAIAAIYVTSYYDLDPIEARAAYFVVGSRVLGPMGDELVSHRTREEAEEFIADHGGIQILRYDEVTRAVVRGLH